MNKLLEIHRLLINNIIKVPNERLNKVVQDYSFYYFDEKLVFSNTDEIYQKIKESKVIIIGIYKEINSKNDDLYFIIGFKKTIIIIKNTLIHLLHSFFSYNNDLNIYFLSDTKKFLINISKLNTKK